MSRAGRKARLAQFKSKSLAANAIFFFTAESAETAEREKIQKEMGLNSTVCEYDRSEVAVRFVCEI